MTTGGYGQWVDFRFPSFSTSWAVTGVEIQLGVEASATYPVWRHDMQVRLLLNGDGVGASRSLHLPGVYSEPVVGGAADRWGTLLSVGDIDEASFGVQIQADLAGTGAKLDYVTIRVYLQDPADDSDHDGTPNNQDLDDDDDAVSDAADNCPTIPNSDQKNTDFDTMGDACEHDDDNDTAPDGVDTCPLTYNFLDLDQDNDSIPYVEPQLGSSLGNAFGGDACDADDDNDKVSDVAEQNCGGQAENATLRPERVDGAFYNTDDNGNTLVDEVLPSGSGAF